MKFQVHAIFAGMNSDPLKYSKIYTNFVPDFELEEARYKQLSDRASAYLAISTAVSVFAAFHLDAGLAAKVFANGWAVIFAILGALAFLMALFLTLLSLDIRAYSARMSDPAKILRRSISEAWDEERFYTYLSVMLCKAIDNNRRNNDARAVRLMHAGWALALSILFFSFLIVAAFISLS